MCVWGGGGGGGMERFFFFYFVYRSVKQLYSGQNLNVTNNIKTIILTAWFALASKL